jgi:hypothetical protein
MVSDKPAATD